MKILRLLALFLLCVFCFATSIDYEGFSIFYGIGQDAFSGYWAINETNNSFSEEHIGVFTNETQLWILHHPVTIYVDESDSVIDFNYRYRYGPIGQENPEWIYPTLDYSGINCDYRGVWYASWSLDHAPLFALPLDSGEYFLEFAISATVAGTEGDTLTASYIVPDSLPFLAYFTVEGALQTGSESSSPINLIHFEASAHRGEVELIWKTESETENSHFLVYRDDVVIGRIEGNGTTTEPHGYSYLDTRILPGIHSYAIADVTWGGEEIMHESISVESRELRVESEEFVLNKAYPNPFNPCVTFNYQLSTFYKVTATIYNTNGDLIKELLNTEMSAGPHDLIWDASDMPSGVYVVTMVVGDVMRSQKIVLMK